MNNKPRRQGMQGMWILLSFFVLAVIVGVFVFLAVQNGWFSAWFGSETEDIIAAETAVVIPDMNSIREDTVENVYYEPDPEDPLADVQTVESYVRMVQLLMSTGSAHHLENLTVTRAGEKYRIESDERLIICDGTQLYLDYGTHTLTTDAVDSLYHEAGLTSLQEIRSMAADTEVYTTEITSSEDMRGISVAITEEETGIRMEFEISRESGLVTTERFYLDGITYRTVITESIEISPNEQKIRDELFKVPNE